MSHNYNNESNNDELDVLVGFTNSLFGAMKDGVGALKNEMTDLLGTNEVNDSEEDLEIEKLHNILDGSLLETDELIRSTTTYRKALAQMNKIESDLIDQLKSCQSHVILKSITSDLADFI
eukprot:UN27986